MGTRTPKALQNAAFYVVGKMFSLRGGTELRNVRISQISRQKSPDRHVYTENMAKNSDGTFKQLHLKLNAWAHLVQSGKYASLDVPPDMPFHRGKNKAKGFQPLSSSGEF